MASPWSGLVRSCTILRTKQTLPLHNIAIAGLRRFTASQHCEDASTKNGLDEIALMLATPTWSVRSLLPADEQIQDAAEVNSEQLHHLLRLSALPPPKTPEEETRMLNDLRAQLHFVKEIQKADTTGVEPLRSIRDTTPEAEKEEEITMDTLADALAKEEVVGKHHKRIRRRQGLPVDTKGAEDWDPLRHTSKKVGTFFVVDADDT